MHTKHGHRISTTLHLAALILMPWLVGCPAAPAIVQAPVDFDRPVDPSLPRAQRDYQVDLTPAHDCEERFDLALYRNRGVELIAWDEAKGACTGRNITVRYLSSQLSDAQLTALVRQHAVSATDTKQ